MKIMGRGVSINFLLILSEDGGCVMKFSVNIVSMLEPQSEVTCHLCYNHVYSFVSCARYMQCDKIWF